jgi:hypothetical protein
MNETCTNLVGEADSFRYSRCRLALI